MSSEGKVPGFFTKLWKWVSTEDSWIVFLNKQFKWAVGFCIRISTVILSVTISGVIAVFMVSELNVASKMKSLTAQGVIDIEKRGAEVTSAPQIDYDKDLNSIDDVIQMLEERRKSGAGAKKNSTVTK